MIVVHVTRDGHIDGLQTVSRTKLLDAVLYEAHVIEGVHISRKYLEERPAGRAIVDKQRFAAIADDRVERGRRFRVGSHMRCNCVRREIGRWWMCVPVAVPVAKF